jgi:osmoprotectant transport system permease protein
MVIISSIAALLVGVPVGVFVTRDRGRAFKAIVNDLGSLSQTIPPVAVLALAVPAVGFGLKPTVLALFLYSILPILRNTVAGLEEVPPATKEAARGMGMTGLQLLFKVELPLAAPVIFAGIRISLVVNVGTATIGAVVGAGGLGNPIISGLIRDNPAFVLEGAVTAAFLAFLLDQIVGRLEKSFSKGA